MAHDIYRTIIVLIKSLILVYSTLSCSAKCPAFFPNGFVVWHCNREPSDTCVFFCDEYYEANDIPIIECLASGEWNVNTTQLCRRKPCGRLSIPNGRLDPECDLLAGNLCDYECSNDFTKLHLNHKLRCNGDNTFEGWDTDPHSLCFLSAEHQCPHLMSHGHLDYSCTRLVNTACSVICDKNFVAKENTYLCNSQVKWSPDILETCQAMPCPSTIPNGKIDFWCSTIVGSSCSYSCNAGFSVVQKSRLTCTGNGEWSPNPSDFCTPFTTTTVRYCTNHIPGGWLSPYCRSEYGAECYYYCDINYEQRYDTIVCLSDGTWDKHLDQMCIGSVNDDNPDYTMSINVGIGIGGLVVIIQIGFLIFACFLRKRSRARESCSLKISHSPSMDNGRPAFVAPPPLYEHRFHEHAIQEAPPAHDQINRLPHPDCEGQPLAYSDVIKDGTSLEITDAYRHNRRDSTQPAEYDNQAFALETVYELLQTESLPNAVVSESAGASPLNATSINTPSDGTLSYI